MKEMSIGEFARKSRLSPKALRLYDELGLLVPARVDDGSGYRVYDAGQLERARLLATLRQLQMPLAEIKPILDLDPSAAAGEIARYWADVESEHAARRRLAGYLVDRTSGKRSVMHEVTTREVPERHLLCLKRTVAGDEQAWALGKEFVAVLRRSPLLRMEGRAGAPFCIYWSQVSEDSDGPLEWCRPVPAEQAQDSRSHWTNVATMRIRDARATEASVLEALQRRSSDVWEDYREQLAANPDAIELPQSFIDNRWTRVAVADDDTPIGFSVVIPGDGPAHELDGLFVEPAHMYRGVGRALVDDAAARARSAGATRLEVTAGPAEGFYEKVGFHLVGTAQTRFGPAMRLSRDL